MVQGNLAVTSKWEVVKNHKGYTPIEKQRRDTVRQRAETLRDTYHEQVDTVQRYLSGVRDLLLEYEAYCCRIEHLRGMASRASGGVILARGGAADKTSRVERFVMEICELQRSLEGEATLLCECLREAQGVLDCLDNPVHRTLLELRYLRGLKWSEAAEKMMYSERTLIRMHREALLTLDTLNRAGCLPFVIEPGPAPARGSDPRGEEAPPWMG